MLSRAAAAVVVRAALVRLRVCVSACVSLRVCVVSEVLLVLLRVVEVELALPLDVLLVLLRAGTERG
jgi:hypothetical protein